MFACYGDGIGNICLICTVFELGAWDKYTDGQLAAGLNAPTLMAGA